MLQTDVHAPRYVQQIIPCCIEAKSRETADLRSGDLLDVINMLLTKQTTTGADPGRGGGVGHTY